MRTAAADAIADTAGANADTAGLLLLMLVIGTGGFPDAGIGAVAAAVPTVAAGLFSGIAVFAAACSSCCSRLTVRDVTAAAAAARIAAHVAARAAGVLFLLVLSVALCRLRRTKARTASGTPTRWPTTSARPWSTWASGCLSTSPLR